MPYIFTQADTTNFEKVGDVFNQYRAALVGASVPPPQVNALAADLTQAFFLQTLTDAIKAAVRSPLAPPKN